MTVWGRLFLMVLAAAAFAACGSKTGERCQNSGDCRTGICVNGRCEPTPPNDAADTPPDRLDSGMDADANDAPPDADEPDASCDAGAARACYSGPSGTSDAGVCMPGTEQCADGGWGPCEGEVTPAAIDSVGDGLDDDCDGTADETDSREPAVVWSGTDYGLVYSEINAGGRDTYFVLVTDAGALASTPVQLNDEPSLVDDYAFNVIAWSGSEFGVSWLRTTDDGGELHFRRVDADGIAIGSDEALGETLCGVPELVWAGSMFAGVFADDGWGLPTLLTIVPGAPANIETLSDFPEAKCDRISTTFIDTSSALGVTWASRAVSGLDFSVQFAGISVTGATVVAPRELVSAGGALVDEGAYSAVRSFWTGMHFLVLYASAGRTNALLLQTDGDVDDSDDYGDSEYAIAPLVEAQGEVVTAFSDTSLQIAFITDLDRTLRAVTTASPPSNARVADGTSAAAFFYEADAGASTEIFMGAATPSAVTLPLQVTPD